MNRLVFSLVMCFATLTSYIYAADKLSISEDFLITPGVTNKEFAICLDNGVTYAAFQFDLYLTEGLTITEFSINRERVPKNTTLEMKEQNNGSYRFMAVANDLKNIIGTSGTILTIKVSASEQASLGNKTGFFRNVKLSNVNGNGKVYNEIAFPILVVAPSTVTAKSYTRKYGEANPTFGYNVEGGSLVGKPAIECKATKTSPAGVYPITIKQGSVKNDIVEYINGTLTVEKAPLTIAAGNYTIKQGEPMPEFTLTYTGFKNNENESILTKPVIISCDANAASEPGEYPITLSGAKAVNYDISYTNGKLIVTQAYAPGDVNGDGEVNVADLVAVSNYMAGDERVSKEKADVNSDGEVNVADLVAISNIMSGNAE